MSLLAQLNSNTHLKETPSGNFIMIDSVHRDRSQFPNSHDFDWKTNDKIMWKSMRVVNACMPEIPAINDSNNTLEFTVITTDGLTTTKVTNVLVLPHRQTFTGPEDLVQFLNEQIVKQFPGTLLFSYDEVNARIKIQNIYT